MESRFENLMKQIRGLDPTESALDENSSITPTSKVIEEQKEYIWLRVYLNEEDSENVIGDDYTLSYLPENEEIEIKFIYYGKKGLDRDSERQVVADMKEDDPKCYCMMVDYTNLCRRNDVDFIRSLFSNTIYYQEQIYRRDDMVLINKKNGKKLEYNYIRF